MENNSVSNMFKKIQKLSDEDLLSEEVREKSITEIQKALHAAGVASTTGIKEAYGNLRLLEMIRRLKNSIENLNRTTSHYSLVLTILTIIMTIAVIIQVCFLFK